MFDTFKKDLGYWLFGIQLIIISIIMLGYYFMPMKAQEEIRNSVSWETLYGLVIILIIFMSILYLSSPINKIINKIVARNKTFLSWYIKYSEKYGHKK